MTHESEDATAYDRFTLADAFDRRTVKSATKLVLGTAALLGLLVIASVLPGLEAVLPGTDVTFLAVADAVVTAAIVAVLVAHWGFASLVVPLLGDAAGLYDLAFLVAALVALVAVGIRVAVVLDPAADRVADALTTTRSPHEDRQSVDGSQSGDASKQERR